MADPAAAEAKMIENLRELTGKSLDQWVEIARSCGSTKHGEIISHLKSAHGLGHGYANLVAHRLKNSSASVSDPDDLIASQYAGPKAALLPIYQAILDHLMTFGDDVQIAAKKAYVSVRAAKQFAIIQPSTASRLDVGLNLKGVEPSGRLEASGSFNSMVSHRVRLGAPAEVDAQLIDWLRAAYLSAR